MPSAKEEPTTINCKIKHLTCDDQAGLQEQSKKQDTPRKTPIQLFSVLEFKHHGRSFPYLDCMNRIEVFCTVI